MVDPVDRERLERLEKRIGEMKGGKAPASKMEEHHAQAHLAWRMVIELVTGIVIGFGIGYWLDSVFGTKPVFMVLFILLGFAAGVRVMLSSAREARKDAQAGTGREDGDNGG